MIEALNTLINALAVGLSVAGRAMLANVPAAEWVLAAVLAGSAWMLSSGRGWRAVGVLAFLVAVGAGTWLSWKTGHHGMVAQQAVLAAMVLAGINKSRCA